MVHTNNNWYINIYFPGGKYLINTGIIIQNSTLTDSLIIQKSSNISVTYNRPLKSEDLYDSSYSHVIGVNLQNLDNGQRYNKFFMKIILPDDQEAFIEEVLFNQSYDIARCNDQFTDCYVYHKFRIVEGLKEDDICWILTTRFGHNISTDITQPGKRFYTNPESCMKLVND